MDSTTSLGREALDRVTGAAQRLAGSVTGRDDLTREGELHKQRADVAADARIEQERAAASQELAEAEQAEREAASERAELIAEKQRQEEMARAERDGAAQEAAVSAATRRAQDAAQADARRTMQQAEAKVQAAQRRKEAAQRHSAELGLQARLAADRAESFEQEPSTLVGKSFARGLATTRLPLTALERLTGHRDGQWAPSVLFGRFEAAVLQTAGGVLRNEDLAAAGPVPAGGRPLSGGGSHNRCPSRAGASRGAGPGEAGGPSGATSPAAGRARRGRADPAGSAAGAGPREGDREDDAGA
ncbi:MAG: hypothetical protein V9G10_10615 [Candidatus Nanopelagicales bacterium]